MTTNRSTSFRTSLAALIAAALACAPGVAAQGTPADYCERDGGPAGAVSDAEHSVLLGDPPLPAGVRSRRVSVDGVVTRVLEAGPATARDAVIFVHGNPGSARDWDELAALTGRFARTVAFDVSGYGESDKLAREVQSVDGAAGYIQGVLDRLGIRRVILVLHDFGGIWGLQWAAQHPDTLTGVVLIGGGVLIDYIPHTLALIWATPGAGEAQMATSTRAGFRAAVESVNPRMPREFVDRMYDHYDRATRCAALRYYRSAAQNFLNMGRQQAEVLRQRRRPALVIWGEKDPYIPPEHAYRQREAFPDARVEIFEDSAHWPFVDNAARTRGLVVPFLRPDLNAARPSAAAGRRRVSLKVSVAGPLPAHKVRARLHRAAPDGTSAGVLGESGAGLTVSGESTLVIRLRRPLQPGRYSIKLRALGLPTRRISVRVPEAR